MVIWSRIGHVQGTSSHGDAYQHMHSGMKDEGEKWKRARGTLDMLEGAMASGPQQVKDNCCAISPKPVPVDHLRRMPHDTIQADILGESEVSL